MNRAPRDRGFSDTYMIRAGPRFHVLDVLVSYNHLFVFRITGVDETSVDLARTPPSISNESPSFFC